MTQEVQEPRLKLRENPDSWKAEIVNHQLFIPIDSSLIDQDVDNLMSKYDIHIEAPEGSVLKRGDQISLEGEAEKVRKFIYDLFPFL